MEDKTNNESKSSKGYKNFMFFGSMRESVEVLPEEQGNKLLRAIMIYGTEGIIVEEDPAILAILYSMIPNIDRTHKRYKEKLEYKKLKQAETDLKSIKNDVKNNAKNSQTLYNEGQPKYGGNIR